MIKLIIKINLRSTSAAVTLKWENVCKRKKKGESYIKGWEKSASELKKKNKKVTIMLLENKHLGM